MDNLQRKYSYSESGSIGLQSPASQYSVKSLSGEFENNCSLWRNHLDDRLADDEFRNGVIDILKKNNIDVIEGDIKKGGFSWVADIGEGQVLHISSGYECKKPHVRHKAPEILQPLTTLYKSKRLKIEVLPKVETEGVTSEHINSLISSLAKKDLLFADCTKGNVGLMKVDGKNIPVVIGDGCVIKVDGKDDSAELRKNYYASPQKRQDNLGHFFDNVISLSIPFEVTGNKRGWLVKYFQKNENYIKYPWVDSATGKWAQEQYTQDKGLEKGKLKGIIQREVIEDIRKRDLSPVAREFVDLLAEYSLREKDARAAATNIIHKNWGDSIPDKKAFRKYVEAARGNAGSGRSI
jgi:hypothetical protein